MPPEKQNKLDESFPPVLAPTLKVINQLETEGLVERYCIGGSLALMNYCETFRTDDLDLYCLIPQKSMLIELSPIYQYLERLGYQTSGEYLVVEGVKVRFLPTHGELSLEAINAAVAVDVEGVLTRVFQYEYAIAMKVQAGRTKDWLHISLALESAEPDMAKLEALLKKFGLFEKWSSRMNG